MRLLTLLLIVSCLVGAFAALNSCPQSTRIDSCAPKCSDDSNCSGAKKCCTNICGSKSCTELNQYQADSNKYKGSSQKGGSGTYCGNVKCNSYEKCELDRTTKRQKCVRG